MSIHASTPVLPMESNFLVPNGTFLVELLAFAILVWIFGKYVIPPINKAMTARQEAIRNEFAELDEAKADARKAEAEYKEQLTNAKHEAARIREEAREQGAQIVQEAREKAQAEADRDHRARPRADRGRPQGRRSRRCAATSAAWPRRWPAASWASPWTTTSVRAAWSSASSPTWRRPADGPAGRLRRGAGRAHRAAGRRDSAPTGAAAALGDELFTVSQLFRGEPACAGSPPTRPCRPRPSRAWSSRCSAAGSLTPRSTC